MPWIISNGKSYVEIIVGTRSRDYAPRALPELFEWENEGQTSISVS